MRFLGTIFIVVGLLSAGVYFLKMNFIFLQWIDNWGSNIAWGIRGAMVLVGIILYVAGKPTEEE